MNRLSRGLVVGGVVASIAGILWRRSPKGNYMRSGSTLNRFVNRSMDYMGRTNLLRFINSSRYVKRLFR